MPESVKSFGTCGLSSFSRCGSLTSLNSDWSLCSTFGEKYDYICKLFHTQPLREIKAHLASNKISFIGDRLKYDDWIPLLKAIKTDRLLHFIEIRSRISTASVQETVNTERKVRELTKVPVFFTNFLLVKIMDAIAGCLRNSKALKCLAFNLIPLPVYSIQTLSVALTHTKSLQHLSLKNCKLGDENCKILCNAIKNTTCLKTLDLSSNDITEQGANYIADLLKTQDIARYGECWKHSLRYRDVPNEVIPGLRRVSLNNNPEIGDKGLREIIDILCDDYWIKALDLQNCGITDWGCTMILKLLKINHEIAVIDVRKNPIVDTTVIATIVNKLAFNVTEEDKISYGWMDLKSSSPLSSADSSSSIHSFLIKSPSSLNGKNKFNTFVNEKQLASKCDQYIRASCSTSVVDNRAQQKNTVRNTVKRTNSSMALTSFTNNKRSVELVMGEIKKHNPQNVNSYAIKSKSTNKVQNEPMKVTSRCAVIQTTHHPSSKTRAIGVLSETLVNNKKSNKKIEQWSVCRPWSTGSDLLQKLTGLTPELDVDFEQNYCKQYVDKQDGSAKKEISNINQNNFVEGISTVCNKNGKGKQQKKTKKYTNIEPYGNGSSKENGDSNLIVSVSKTSLKVTQRKTYGQIVTRTKSGERSTMSQISFSGSSDSDKTFKAQTRKRVAKLHETFEKFLRSQDEGTVEL